MPTVLVLRSSKLPLAESGRLSLSEDTCGDRKWALSLGSSRESCLSEEYLGVFGDRSRFGLAFMINDGVVAVATEDDDDDVVVVGV